MEVPLSLAPSSSILNYDEMRSISIVIYCIYFSFTSVISEFALLSLSSLLAIRLLRLARIFVTLLLEELTVLTLIDRFNSIKKYQDPDLLFILKYPKAMPARTTVRRMTMIVMMRVV